MKTPEGHNVEIPIIIRKGAMEFFYGGPLPQLKTGRMGSLIIPADAFVRPSDVQLLSVTETVAVLEEGTTLHAHISLQEGVTPPKGLTALHDVSGFWGYGSFAPIILQEALRMTFRGTKKPMLEDCKCKLPGLDKIAKSINESYTRLSEFYEPTRRSHTGNVFAKVVYFSKSQRFWLPLDLLREAHQLAFEEKHFKDGLFAVKPE